MRIPHPVTVTRTALAPRGGKLIFLAIVVGAALQAAGWADFTPDPTASERPPVNCAEHAEYHRTSTTVAGQRVPCPQP
jgi:hypothetical protein